MTDTPETEHPVEPKRRQSLGGAEPRGSCPEAGIIESPQVAAVALALFAMAVCYLRTFVSFDVPILPSGDAVGFVVHGTKIVAGQLPYRDYFSFVAPGADLIYALLIKCFGPAIWLPHFAMICLAGATVVLITLIAARFVSGTTIWLPGLLFTGFVLIGSLDATHHWFSTVAVMAAIAVLLNGTTLVRIASAGALCGLTACFTQTKGTTVLVGLVVYVLWKTRRRGASAGEGWRKCLLLCAAAAAVFLAVNLHFMVATGVSRWLYCLVVYPLRYYTVPAVNNWRVLEYDFHWHQGVTRWLYYPFAYAIPFMYVVFAVAMRRSARKNRGEYSDELVLILLAGVAMLLAIATAPSVKRLLTVSPPVLILLAWLLNRTGKAAASLKIVLGIAAVAMAIEVPVRQQFHWHADLDLPAGRTAFLDRGEYQEYGWVLEHSRAGQYFFGMPPMDLPFHFATPSAAEALETSEYTRPEQVAAIIQELKQHPMPFMILASSQDWPRDIVSPANHLGPFQDYLRKNFRMTKTFWNRDELWEPIESVSSGASGSAHSTE
jgi:hypothetical protein